jgi:hypothetical protein
MMYENTKLLIDEKSLEDLTNGFAFLDWAGRRGIKLDAQVIKSNSFGKLCHNQAILEILENPYILLTDDILNIILHENGLSKEFMANRVDRQIKLVAVR